MELFLLFGTLGFVVYEALAWFRVPRDSPGPPGFAMSKPDGHIGGIAIHLTPTTRTAARRIFRVAFSFALVGTALIVHQSFLPSGAVSRNRFTILLGMFWGPLFGIWINAVLRHSGDKKLSRGLAVGGIGLALLFTLGSFGDETAKLMREYARKISNVKIAGAELSFSDRMIRGSPGAGALPPSGRQLVSGSAGLQNVADLSDRIQLDEEYLDLFTRVSVKGHQSFLNRVQNRDVWKRNKLTEEINKDQTQMEVTRTTLRAAKQFAEQSLSKPLNCLVNWYESSADATAINRHLAVYIDIFGRLRAAADEPQRLEQNQLDDVADRLITLWLAIALEPSVSGPQSLLHEKCDTFLEQFCADEIEAAKKFRQSPRHNVALENLSTTEADTKFGKPLRSCLQKFAPSANGPPRLWPPHLSELRDHLAASIKKFAETGGVKARPYFVVGYASMLAQLGQYRAAGVLLDDWLRMRAVSKSEWQLGDTWFEMRARTTLASYMEEWIRKDDAQPPTTVLDEHLKNLDLIRKDFKIRMLGVKFFEEAFRPSRSFSKVEGICASDDPDIETWRKLFESYVTMELTYAQAMLVHVEYEDRFSEETTELLEQFSVMDFACVPDTVKFDPTPAKVYQAQVLEAFARNALMYNDARKSDGDEAKIKRLDRAIEAIRSAQRALQDALKKSGRATPREASTFLEKVTTSEVTATQDKLRSTLGRVKRAHQELSQ